ncbi:MAG: 50S ribosomal protein L10 [Bdellovibrionales bacterium]|nr:50S ribosomal protein L10 [Bdellovibrionales bacterium]
MVGKEVKKKQVAALSENFSKSRGTFLVNCIGLNVEEMTGLRKNLKSKQANITVIRNTLARLALANRSDMKEAYEPFIKGSNAFVMAFGEDVPSVAKTLYDFQEENEVFKIKCGLLDGSALSSAEVAQLAKLPSREVLRASFLAVLSASPSKFLRTLQAVPGDFVRVLNSYKENK